MLLTWLVAGFLSCGIRTSAQESIRQASSDPDAKTYVIIASDKDGQSAVTRATIDSVCNDISDLFACSARWAGGATGSFPSGPGSLKVSEFLNTLSDASGTTVDWALVGDRRFDMRDDGVRTTNVADASSTSVFAVEMEFDPFASSGQPPCKAKRQGIPCELDTSKIVVQRDAAAHLLTLADHSGIEGLRDRSLRFTTMGTGVDIYIVDGNVGENDEFKDLTNGRERRKEGFMSESAASNKEFSCSADHGTHVASLAAGLSYGLGKNASIIPVAVQPGCGLSGRVSDLAQGLSWIITQMSATSPTRPTIVSMSLQLPRSDPAAQVIDSLVANLIEVGAIVVAAAGNYRADACDFSPSGLPSVITVGALDTRLPWSDSNFGKCVDIWAPGVTIIGASPSCYKCTASFTGTSQAAPIVTGLIATQLESYPADDVPTIKKWLRDNAVTLDNIPGNQTYKAARAQRDWGI